MNRSGYLQLSTEDFYKKYKKSEVRQTDLVTYGEYSKILRYIFTEIWQMMIKSLWIYMLPYSLGSFFIGEKQNNISGFYTDWKTKKKKYNLHTDGRKFYIKWDKTLTKESNIYMYTYHSYRGSGEKCTGSRGLAHHIKYCSETATVKNFRAYPV